MSSLFTIYFIILILSGIFINGFYLITRGQWNIKADGTKEWNGKIFSYWSKFFQQHTISQDVYKFREFSKQLTTLRKFFADDDILEVLYNGVVVKEMDVQRVSFFESFAASNELLFNTRKFGNGQLIEVYKEVKKFKIPFFITAPLGECVTCMSSFFGTICWVFWYSLICKIQTISPSIPGKIFTELPTLSIIGLWAFFCISLSWVNEIIFIINYKLRK